MEENRSQTCAKKPPRPLSPQRENRGTALNGHRHFFRQQNLQLQPENSASFYRKRMP